MELNPKAWPDFSFKRRLTFADADTERLHEATLRAGCRARLTGLAGGDDAWWNGHVATVDSIHLGHVSGPRYTVVARQICNGHPKEFLVSKENLIILDVSESR